MGHVRGLQFYGGQKLCPGSLIYTSSIIIKGYSHHCFKFKIAITAHMNDANKSTGLAEIELVGKNNPGNVLESIKIKS